MKKKQKTSIKPSKISLSRILLLLLLVLLITVRFLSYKKNIPKYSNGTTIKLSGKLMSEPIQYETAQGIKLNNFYFYLPSYPKFSYGDFIIVQGEVKGNGLRKPRLLDVKEGGLLFGTRQKLLRFYERSLPADHAALISGVVIGAKSGISRSLWDSFKTSGTAHVVVASGMNVTLVSSFILSFFLLFLNRRKAIIFALLAIWLYALISGFDAPIVRACIMGTIAFTAQEVGRLNFAYRSLLITSFLMLFLKPTWIEDLGFWLSFTATLFILRFEKPIENKLDFVPLKVIRQDFATTLSAQIGVAPILYYFFGQFSFLSPFINVLVLWTVVPITLIGMTAGLVGLVSEAMGRLILLIAYPLTGWFLFVVGLFS